MLSGIRVIDFTNYIPGPFASLRLAELGADVIKVEPIEGDPSRASGGNKDKDGPVFRGLNRQKKSITINVKTEQGKEIALGLIKKADVVIESFRPGVMTRLGLDYENVKKRNPEIIYCSISGYGQHGSLSKLGNHDLNYLALSGILAQLKDQRGKPIHPTITLADYFGGLAANERILAGLLSRNKTGSGSYHSISITDVMVSLMGNHLIVAKETGYQNGLSVLNGEIISYGIYETKDRRYVSLGALEPKFWRNFCLAVGRVAWVGAQFSIMSNKNPVYNGVKALFKQKTLSEWAELSREVDCCLAPILEVGEIKDYPYFKQKNILYTAPWEDEQTSMHDDMQLANRTAPPTLGEHTFHILKEILQVSESQVKDWEEQGII